MSGFGKKLYNLVNNLFFSLEIFTAFISKLLQIFLRKNS